MIDSHCHLADKAFAGDLDAVLWRAKEAGVDRIVTIADSIEESEMCVKLAERYDPQHQRKAQCGAPQVFCTVGVHPHRAKDWDWDADSGRRTLAELVTSSSKTKAIGEIGLDYHYNHSPRDIQRAVFLEQLKLAKELGLPAVVHCRESIEDVRAVVLEVQPSRLVLHCCCEAWQDVSSLVERGHFLSFTGIATYPKSETIRETIKQCPIEKLMVETDAPYLPPEALRAKGGRRVRNEPAFVVEVAKLVAALKGMSLADVDRQTTANTVEFFGLPS